MSAVFLEPLSLLCLLFCGGREMILSYQDLFEENARRTRVKAKITTEHSASSYGQPVIVLEDGGALDLPSWVMLNYRVEKATEKELQALQKLGLL
jgi:hypothetical protein